MSKSAFAIGTIPHLLMWLLAGTVFAQSAGTLPRPGGVEPQFVLQQHSELVAADPLRGDEDSIIRPISARSAVAAQSGCGHSCCASNCCRCQCCPHRSGMFAELLVLQATDADVPFAVTQNLAGAPVGGTGVIDPTYETGFRVGGLVNLDCKSSLSAVFTWYESTANAALSASAPNIATPLTAFPGTLPGTDLNVQGSYNIRLQMGDIEYRSLWRYGPRYAVNWVAGIRGGHIDQDLVVRAPVSGTTTTSNIDFDGLGIRFGLEAERQIHPDHAFRLYGKASGSLLSGEFENTYVQTNLVGTQATTNWSDDRVVPVLDCELGVNWTNQSGNLRFAAGWMVQAWFNTVSTNDWIGSVQANNFAGSSDTLTFSGVVARMEFLLP